MNVFFPAVTEVWNSPVEIKPTWIPSGFIDFISTGEFHTSVTAWKKTFIPIINISISERFCMKIHDVTLTLCGKSDSLVDGTWDQWAEWGPCTETCGGGTRERTRDCIGPYNGGQSCQGLNVDTENCNTQECPPGRYFTAVVCKLDISWVTV